MAMAMATANIYIETSFYSANSWIRLQAFGSREILGATQGEPQCEGTGAVHCYDETRMPRTDHCMVRKEEMIKGRYLRTLSDAWSVPAGTLARVETVGRIWQGEFVFTVRGKLLKVFRGCG
jgi:hypothetical protein